MAESKAVDVPMTGALDAIKHAKTPADRAKLQQYAMELITAKGFARPVPRFATELPFVGDDTEVQLRIAGAILVAEDPDAAQTESGAEASKELLGRPLTVWDLRVAPSDKEGGLGAFLILDVTEEHGEVHKVVTTGAMQAIVRLARAWVDDELPLQGSFSSVPNTGRQGTPVITFIADKAF